MKVNFKPKSKIFPRKSDQKSEKPKKNSKKMTAMAAMTVKINNSKNNSLRIQVKICEIRPEYTFSR